LSRLVYFLPAIAIAFVILFLSIADGQDLPQVNLLNADKLAHLVCYFVFTSTLVWAFQKVDDTPRLGVSVAIAFFYGAAMEMAQGLFIVSRHFDLFDLIANGVGCLIAAIILPVLLKR